MKEATPRGLLVGSPQLSAELQRLDLVDEFRFVVHPVVAGHGPYLFPGLQPSLRLVFVRETRLKSGIVVLHYRRRANWRLSKSASGRDATCRVKRLGVSLGLLRIAWQPLVATRATADVSTTSSARRLLPIRDECGPLQP